MAEYGIAISERKGTKVRKMKNRGRRLLLLLFIALLFIVPITGCSTTKLDNPSQKQNKSDDWMEEETKEAEETDKKMEVSEEEEYLDVESAEEEEIDYSKYEEKKETQRQQNGTIGNVTYSDGADKEKDKYETEPVPEGQQKPVEPGTVEINKNKEYTCYLSVSCSTILDSIENLTEGKETLVPEDGVIYSEREVTFYEGESVFDVLQREMKNNRIHLESSFTPKYNSAYVEGINNLYEFDCGRWSGWMYEVNGWYPNYGCSRYIVQPGDVIKWNYTCDLGRDLGQTWPE